MKRALTLSLVEVDPDYVRLRVDAANDDFRGSILLYADIDFAEEWATPLDGFPRTRSAQQVLELGTFQLGYAGGGARLTFRIVDGAGHIEVQVDLASEPSRDPPPSSVSLKLQLEAASIDNFIREVQAIGRYGRLSATLSGS